jgi:hypothetical protein
LHALQAAMAHRERMLLTSLALETDTMRKGLALQAAQQVG